MKSLGFMGMVYVGLVFSDPSIDGPNLHIQDQTISSSTGYGNDLGTISTSPGSEWSLAQWAQRGVITPAEIQGSRVQATDPVYGQSLYNFKKPDGSEGLTIYCDPATGHYAYNLMESSNSASIAGESDLFLQVGAPTVAGRSFANPLTLTFDAKMIQADARYNVASKTDPASPVAQVAWGAVALFDQIGGPHYQLFLSGGVTDSRYGTTPVNYSLETQLPDGTTQVLFNSTAAGSAPIDYFASNGPPQLLSYSLTGALEQAILTLGLDTGKPQVDNLASWSLNGVYLGVESQTGTTGPNSLTTEIQLSNIQVTSDPATVLRPEDTRAGAQLVAPTVPAHAAGFDYTDISSGLSGSVAGTVLTGNQYGIQALYTYTGSDDVAISANRSDVMIIGGSGQSIISSLGGTNVLEAGTGTSWLTGCAAGAGSDTFMADLQPNQTRWVGVSNFHSGEWSLIEDVLPGAATWAWKDVSGYMGRPIMELDIKDNFGGETSMNFDGLKPSDLRNVETDAKNIGGLNYLQVTFY